MEHDLPCPEKEVATSSPYVAGRAVLGIGVEDVGDGASYLLSM